MILYNIDDYFINYYCIVLLYLFNFFPESFSASLLQSSVLHDPYKSF